MQFLEVFKNLKKAVIFKFDPHHAKAILKNFVQNCEEHLE